MFDKAGRIITGKNGFLITKKMTRKLCLNLMNNMLQCVECGFKIESSSYIFDYEETDIVED